VLNVGRFQDSGFIVSRIFGYGSTKRLWTRLIHLCYLDYDTKSEAAVRTTETSVLEWEYEERPGLCGKSE
jgi:hypothetical protein